MRARPKLLHKPEPWAGLPIDAGFQAPAAGRADLSNLFMPCVTGTFSQEIEP